MAKAYDNMSLEKLALPNSLSGWLKQSGVALCYLLFGIAIHRGLTDNGIVSVVWPGSGLALAVLLTGGRSYLWGVFAGSLLLNWYSNSSPWAIAGITLANGLEAVAGYWLLTRNRLKVSLNTLPDYLRLIVWGGAVSSVVGAGLGALSLLLAGYIAATDFLDNFQHWWMGDTLGVVLLAPFLLVWWQGKFVYRSKRQWLETLLLAGLTFVAGQIVFMGWLGAYLSDTPKGYWIFLFVAWSAIRLGRRGTTLVVLMIALQAITGAYNGIGFFAHEIARANLHNYWAYMLILSVVGMSLATYVNEINEVLVALRLKDNALNAAGNAISISDKTGRIEWANRAFSQLTGYGTDEVVGRRHRDLVRSGKQDRDFYASLWETISANRVWQGELVNRRKDGTLYDEEMTIAPLCNERGEITHFVAVKQDISGRKAMVEKIRNLAFYDHLTQLPNRRSLMDRLNKAKAASARSGRSGALLFIDLDNFKSLNDTLGHDIGDLLLQQVAKRLESCVRTGDMVARLGGDEFVVMLEGLSELPIVAAAQTEAVGEKILATLNQIYQLETHEYHNSPSIGAILFNDASHGIEELMKQADIAMYQAKKDGRNTLRFFDPQMQSAINARAEMESELRRALEERQFQLHYQIQVDSTHLPVGAECLIRWIHPERGMVSPARFIPLAEETGLILPIGFWVLDSACARLGAWQQDVLTRDLVLSVNVSARQFRQPDFVDQVREAIQRHAIHSSRLKLELTESLLLEDVEDTIATMNALKKIGVQFSLDDFGTGYSSLQYLKLLPLDQLKIDQSFVRDIVADNSDRAIVRTIIAMAHSLNLDVIAEGVETEQQRHMLVDNGCSHFQGYLFGKPVAIEQFEAMLGTLRGDNREEVNACHL